MPSDIRAVTDAIWAGEQEGLRSTSCGWIDFGDHLLETYSSTQQFVALSTAESEFFSIAKGAAHALEVRSAMVKFGMTFNVVCETDASAWTGNGHETWCKPRASLRYAIVVAAAVCAEGVVDVRAKPGDHNEADLGTKIVDLRRVTTLLNAFDRQWVGACGWWRLQNQQNIAMYWSGT